MKKFIILLLTLLFYMPMIEAQDIYPAIFEDVGNSANFPAKNETIAIKIDGSFISVYALLAKDSTKKQTVIFCHGLPGNEKNLDLVQVVRRSGRNAIYFNYRGSWGSQGEFSYRNSLNDLRGLICFLSKPKNAEAYRIDTSNFILVGHIYGGGIALVAGATIKNVKKIITISPASFGKYKTKESQQWLTNFMQSEEFFMLNQSNDFIQDVIDNTELYDPVNYKDFLSHKSVLVIDENERHKPFIDPLIGVDHRIWENTDHSFANKRIALAKAVLNWISNDIE